MPAAAGIDHFTAEDAEAAEENKKENPVGRRSTQRNADPINYAAEELMFVRLNQRLSALICG
jgi:hypothetical protein